MRLVHGGDIYSYAAKHGGKLPLDFSANINPLGIPDGVKEALQCAIAMCDRYPDPLCRTLRQAISMREGIASEHIFCGNGAADVLYRIAAVCAPRHTLLIAPAFAEYESSLADRRISFHQLRQSDDFAVTERILWDIVPGIQAVYLCNPNNPTGRLIDPALLLQIAEKCHALGIYLIADECFLDFVENGIAYSLRTYLKDFPKTIVLRAFTKMYAIPGVRLGYCMSGDAAWLQRLYQVGQPWNVSVLAQAAGIAALQENDFMQKTVCMIQKERGFLEQALKTRGFRVYEGAANFMLLQSENASLHKALEKQGVLIRNCANYRGLSAGFYRIAVRSHRENEQLLAALDRCLDHGEDLALH